MSFSERYSLLLEVACRLGELQLGIVGKDGVAVVGTGDYRNKVGSSRPRGCHLTRPMEKERVALIEEPGFDDECASCENRHRCAYSVILTAPIFTSGQHAGNLGLLAQDPELRERILNNPDQWVEYLGELSSAFSNYSHLISVLQLRSMTDAALNQVFHVKNHQGLIVADNDQGILRLNDTAKQILHLSGQEELTRQLSSVLPEEALGRLFSGDSHDSATLLRLQDRHFRLSRLDSACLGPGEGVALVIDELSSLSHSPPFGQKLEPPALGRIIGTSPAVREVKEVVGRVARHPFPVLIQGESGTGKELVAKAIHELSPRRDKRLVAVNCSAIPDTLFESELFGYERGAFTGAAPNGKKGYLELAQGGTLFLDELGELSLANQAKLLRVLEEKEFYRLGGQQLVACDVRVVAATNAPLSEMVAQRTFREDLYYRLNVVRIFLPPLRERQEDILPLVSHFLSLHDSERAWTLEPQVRETLIHYSWPGNIRELRNTVDYMAALAGDGPLTAECLPACFQNIPEEENTLSPGGRRPDAKACLEALEAFGRTTQGKRLVAARLGVSLATFYRLLKRYGLQ